MSPALPDGASLDGSVTCPEVYVSGDSRPTESACDLDAGTYYFVTSSCSSTLTLTDASGNLQILGDVYTVTPDPTALAAVAVETDPTSAPTSVTLTAEVIDQPQDYSPLPNQMVTFNIQNSDGIWLVDACSAVTAFNANYTAAFGSCTLSSQDAAALVQGTGAWTANFAGGRDYQGASVNRLVPGQTSFTQAATNFNNQVPNITVTTYTVPPNCTVPAAQQENPTLSSVLLAGVDCSQLHIIQIVTGVVLGAATIAAVGTGAVVSAASDVTEPVAIQICKDAESAFLDAV